MKPIHCRAARALLDLDRGDLARRAGLSPTTLEDFETEKSTLQRSSAERILAVFRTLGVEILDGPGGIGVRTAKEPTVPTEPDVVSAVSFTPSQCRAARGLLGWKPVEACAQLGLGPSSLHLFEHGARELRQVNRERIEETFGRLGVSFSNRRPQLSVHLDQSYGSRNETSSAG